MARHPLILVYGLALIPALVMALSQPVWSRVDEAEHADFIVQLSHGIYPVADKTLIAPETLGVMRTTGKFGGAAPGTRPTPDLADLGPPPPGMSARANAAWMSRHLWQLSFESVQTPGYYILMVPVWLVADALGGPFGAIYTLRLINVLLIALLAPMSVAVARIVSPGRPEVAAIAAVFAILLPGLDLNGTRISNDGLAAVLGGLAVLLMVRWAGDKWSWRRAVLIGLILGAGLMVKLTLAGLLPALAIAAMWPARGTTWRGNLSRVVVSAAIALGCLVPWFVVNLHNYGGVVPGARAARLSDAAPASFTAPFVPFDVGVLGLTYWSGEPFGALPLSAPFAILGSLLALMALAGLIRILRTRSPFIPAPSVVVGIAAVAGMVALTLLSPALGGFEFAGAGRYVYPALPAGAALGGLGICAVLARATARRAIGTTYALAAVGVMTLGVAGLPAAPEPGPGSPPSNATTFDVSASGQLQGVTVRVDHVALDPATKVTWFHVTVDNAGPGEAEWPAQAFASAGAVLGYGDYRMSTHLRGDIDAGESTTGWLWVGLDPATFNPAQSVRLRVANVAVNDYSSVEDVDVVVALRSQTTSIESSPVAIAGANRAAFNTPRRRIAETQLATPM
jgi:4-amino-4-deoxy-L-arabinose transferase-like glycosyltransferase